jgi:hypothetical protein
LSTPSTTCKQRVPDSFFPGPAGPMCEKHYYQSQGVCGYVCDVLVLFKAHCCQDYYVESVSVRLLLANVSTLVYISEHFLCDLH